MLSERCIQRAVGIWKSREPAHHPLFITGRGSGPSPASSQPRVLIVRFLRRRSDDTFGTVSQPLSGLFIADGLSQQEGVRNYTPPLFLFHSVFLSRLDPRPLGSDLALSSSGPHRATPYAKHRSPPSLPQHWPCRPGEEGPSFLGIKEGMDDASRMNLLMCGRKFSAHFQNRCSTHFSTKLALAPDSMAPPATEGTRFSSP